MLNEYMNLQTKMKDQIKDYLEPNITQESSNNILGFNVINIKKEKDKTNFESNTATAFDRVVEHESEKQSSKIKTNSGSKKPLECKVCNKRFGHNWMLTRHMKSHTRKKPYECSDCNKKFSLLCQMKRHKKYHEVSRLNKTIPCEICHKSFAGTGVLKLHMNMHTREKVFKCSECDKEFLLKNSFEMHLLTHKDKPISCEICHKIFGATGTLKVHMNIHTREKIFKCSECNEEFLRKSGFKIHWLRVHKKEKLVRGKSKAAIEKPHQCEYCDKKFMGKSILIDHTRVHTGEKPFECSRCGKKYARKDYMKLHMQTHMPKINKAAIKKPHKCELCGKEFVKRHELINHTRVHTGEKPFECSKCGKKYTSKATMRKHIKKHMEKIKKEAIEKPHKCEHCGKKFLQRYMLIQHTRVHTGERPFECSKCGKKFTHKVYLKFHMQRRHVKKIKKSIFLQPISCEICHKNFGVASALKLHMNKHTREKVFKCSKCSKEFLQKDGLKRHCLLMHKKENLKEIPYSNSGEKAMLSMDDSMGVIKPNFKTIKAEKIDVIEIAITECVDNEEKVKLAADGEITKSCFGESICKEEVILPDLNLN